MSERFSEEMAGYYGLLADLISSGDIAAATALGMTETQIENVLRLISRDTLGPSIARKRLLEAGRTLVHFSQQLQAAAARGNVDSSLLGDAAAALERCDFDRASDLLKALEEAAEERDDKAGGTDLETAQAAFARGELEVSRNRWEDAYDHFRRAAEAAPEDWDFLERASYFAWKNDRFAEALEFDRRRLAIAEASGDARKISTALLDLGVSLKESGQLTEAVEMYQRAIENDIRDLGEEHKEVAHDYSNLAIVLHDLGEYDRSLEYAKKAVAIGSRHLDENDSKLLSWKNTLAAVLHVIGRQQEALALLEEVVAITQRDVPEDDPSLAPKLLNLGKMYETSDRLEDAKRVLLDALRIYERTYSMDARATTGVLNRLGKVLQKLGHFQAALFYFEKARDIILRTSSDHGLDFAAVANNLAVLYGYLGRFEEAIPLIERSLAIRQIILPRDHPYIKVAKENLDSMKGASLLVKSLQ